MCVYATGSIGTPSAELLAVISSCAGGGLLGKEVTGLMLGRFSKDH